MSASAEKRNRRAAREAGTDKKLLAYEAEAKKKAQSRTRWTVGVVCAVLAVVLLLVFGSTNFLYHVPTALTVGGENYTAAEVNYYYASQYYTFVNQYGGYAYLFGLDTSSGLSGLAHQDCPMTDSGTWRDYFLEMAQEEIREVRALCDYAEANGITLTEEEIAEVDDSFADMSAYATALGFSGADAFYSSNYGRGVTMELARQITLDTALANKAYTQVYNDTTYSPELLEEYYQGLEGSSDLFDYAYYYVAAEAVESTNEAGETVSAATEETIAAAEAKAQAILDAYEELAAGPNGDYAALLDEAVASVVENGAAVSSSGVSGSSLNASFKDFLMGSRKAGDAQVAANASADGSYVVVFLSRDDNHYPTANVRHILVKAEADPDGTYSDEAKEAAKARAEEILAEWKEGKASEETFAALAERYSEDGGSNTNGGLYENVPKGQMVEEFDAFCFEGHQPGDTAIVYGESSSYAGYHVMYYVGEGDLYSDIIARSAMLSQDMSQWVSDLTEAYPVTTRFAYRYAG